MKQKTLFPQFTYGTDAYEGIAEIMKPYGNKAVIVHGKKAYLAAKDKLLSALEKDGVEVTGTVLYGHEATFANVDLIVENEAVKEANVILAVGGGKCIDTCKCVSARLNKPIISIPTIASNCAPVTEIAIMYDGQGVYQDTVTISNGVLHTFIDTEIIADSPDQYFRAGIGDTLAKYVEASFSARGDTLSYEDELGLKTAELCFYPVIENGLIAIEAKKLHKPCEELTKTALRIIVSTGVVSICVGQKYNTALAHAMAYGFSCRSDVQDHHLHGDIVAYGVLIQELVDHQDELFRREFEFHKKAGLPTKLSDLGLNNDDPLDDVLEIAVNNKGMEHIPYHVSREMIREAVKRLETMNSD